MTVAAIRERAVAGGGPKYDSEVWALLQHIETLGAAGDVESAAVTLGRRGGLKGGKARAEALTPERRSEIAFRAARARWDK